MLKNFIPHKLYHGKAVESTRKKVFFKKNKEFHGFFQKKKHIFGIF